MATIRFSTQVSIDTVLLAVVDFSHIFSIFAARSYEKSVIYWK